MGKEETPGCQDRPKLRRSPGGHSRAYGARLPSLGRAPTCPHGGDRRRPLAPGIGFSHAAERDGVGSGRHLLRGSNAREGGGGPREREDSVLPPPQPQWCTPTASDVARRSPATVGAGMRTASKGQLAVRPWTMPGSTARRVPRAPQRAVSKMTGPPLRGPKPAGVAGLISITVTPEHKGLLKDTVDFSQYKSDSTSRPARGWRTHLMILPR